MAFLHTPTNSEYSGLTSPEGSDASSSGRDDVTLRSERVRRRGASVSHRNGAAHRRGHEANGALNLEASTSGPALADPWNGNGEANPTIANPDSGAGPDYTTKPVLSLNAPVGGLAPNTMPEHGLLTPFSSQQSQRSQDQDVGGHSFTSLSRVLELESLPGDRSVHGSEEGSPPFGGVTEGRSTSPSFSGVSDTTEMEWESSRKATGGDITTAWDETTDGESAVFVRTKIDKGKGRAMDFEDTDVDLRDLEILSPPPLPIRLKTSTPVERRERSSREKPTTEKTSSKSHRHVHHYRRTRRSVVYEKEICRSCLWYHPSCADSVVCSSSRFLSLCHFLPRLGLCNHGSL